MTDRPGDVLDELLTRHIQVREDIFPVSSGKAGRRDHLLALLRDLLAAGQECAEIVHDLIDEDAVAAALHHRKAQRAVGEAMRADDLQRQ